MARDGQVFWGQPIQRHTLAGKLRAGRSGEGQAAGRYRRAEVAHFLLPLLQTFDLVTPQATVFLPRALVRHFCHTNRADRLHLRPALGGEHLNLPQLTTVCSGLGHFLDSQQSSTGLETTAQVGPDPGRQIPITSVE